MKNVFFPARVNLLMEVSVIGTFILIIEERFSLLLIPQILQAQKNS